MPAMTPPPITREARDWLLNYVKQHQHVPLVMRDILDKMPLAPADPLDAVRARWKVPHGYNITACDGKIVLGRNFHGNPVLWSATTGDCLTIPSVAYPLTPVSPHSALIAELKTVDMHQPSEMYSLCKRAADALEKLPCQWTEFSYEPLFRRPPASAWMPIETAPRDGTLILTAGQTRGVNLSYWLDNNDTEYPWAGWRSLERVEVAHADKLTHWQPLPPPPDSPGAPAKTLDQWHEDFGPVVWFCWDSDNKRWLGEPAWIGTPNDDSWPEYHTHWIPHPDMPPPPDSPGSTEGS